MEDRKQKAQELDVEQLEKASGGGNVSPVFKCPGCEAVFYSIGAYQRHVYSCPNMPHEQQATTLP